MILALLVVVLLLLAGLAMLTNSQYTAIDTMSTEQKNLAFDAADAGLNAAMDQLDGSLASTGSQNNVALANGYQYSFSIDPNLIGTNPKNINDPIAGNVKLPPGSALVTSNGVGPNAGRSSTIEAVVQVGQNTITFTNDAIDAKGDIQGNWNSGNCIGVKDSSNGAKDANVHANGNITANACFVDGIASASGSVTGSVNASCNTAPCTVNNAPQVAIPVMPPFIAQEKTLAQQYSYNSYIDPNSGGSMPTSFTCDMSKAGANGCVVFYDGAFSMAGQTSLTFTGRVTLVINGSYSSTGLSSLTMQSGTKSMLVVNGSADVGGNGSAAALIWANSDVTLNGNAFVLGAIVSNGNVDLHGGGNGGGLQRDATLQNVSQTVPGKTKVIAYAEY